MVTQETTCSSLNKAETETSTRWLSKEILFSLALIIVGVQSCLFLRADDTRLAIIQVLFFSLTIVPPVLMLSESGLSWVRGILGERRVNLKFGIYYTIVLGSVNLVREIAFPDVNYSITDAIVGPSELFSLIIISCGITLFLYTLKGDIQSIHDHYYWKDIVVLSLFILSLTLDEYSFGLFLSQVKHKGNLYIDLSVFFHNLVFVYLYVALPLFLFFVLRRFSLRDVGWKLSIRSEDVNFILLSSVVILLAFFLVGLIEFRKIVYPWDSLSLDLWFLKLTYTLFFLAFYEEFFFRGLLINLLKKKLNGLSSLSVVIISAAIYAVYGIKYSINHGLWLFFMGIILGYVFVKRENLLPCCLISAFSHLIVDQWDFLLESV